MKRTTIVILFASFLISYSFLLSYFQLRAAYTLCEIKLNTEKQLTKDSYIVTNVKNKPGSFKKLRIRNRHTPFILLEDVDFSSMTIYNKQDRKSFKFVFGIHTDMRKSKSMRSYLITILKSLITKSDHAPLGEVLFLIYVSDIDGTNQCQVILYELNRLYPVIMENGFIEIVCPHSSMYPDVNALNTTLGDDRNTFNGRIKYTLDYAFMMLYGCKKGQYYMLLEDYQEVAYGYIEQIDSFVESLNMRSDIWLHALFSDYGTAGVLMKSDDALALARYLLLKFTNHPCDWLLQLFQVSSICYSVIKWEECTKLMFKDTIFNYRPSLFKHIDQVSSFSRPNRIMGNGNFRDIEPSYVNPLAQISTNFITDTSNVVSKVYLGIGDFCASKVNKDDYIIIKFINPQPLQEITVQTGTPDFPNDILSHGMIQFREAINSTNLQFLCNFDKGQAECNFSSGNKDITEIRIVATEDYRLWVRFKILLIK